MFFRLAADLLVIIHLLFIIFVITGGFLVLKWPRMKYLHIPAAMWGALIEFQGWICPLTPLEQHLRRSGGQFAYSGGFVEHYVEPIVYPAGLTREMQILFGIAVVAINLLAYGWLLIGLKRDKKRKE
ncbi:MAG: DUF2784 domain-containing protein [Proteobacteria bacterium]|nr:DUF2784 domain-containing protein [Pseudomonadota bacterium]MBU4295893.1 DUF2784 domain-containing protein [Pseudomonadota bacterium]MCG2749417.1 DUF2784 domain-containing protein [Desulfobulbaceae bacterium]